MLGGKQLSGLNSKKQTKESSDVSRYKLQFLSKLKDDSVVFCSDCERLFSYAQSQKISCRPKDQDASKTVQVDFFGNQILGHSLQAQRKSTDSQADLIVDIEHFIRFFREKYRVCWKEIYLKFLPLVG